MPEPLPEAIAEAKRLREAAWNDWKCQYAYLKHLSECTPDIIAAYEAALTALGASHRERDTLAAELSTANVRITALECSLKILRHDVQAYAARTGDAVLRELITKGAK